MLVRDALRDFGDDARLLTCGAADAAAGLADWRAWGTDRALLQAIVQVANPRAAMTLRMVRHEFRPDVALVVHFAYHLSPSVFGALNTVPTVLSVMDYKLVCPLGSKLLPDESICHQRAGPVCWRGGCLTLPHWLRDRARYARIHRGMERVTAVLAPSGAVREALARDGIPSQVMLLPVARPSHPPVRRPAPAPVFLYCGRLVREKGLPVLMRALARVRDRVPGASLRLVGDGDMRAELVRLAATLGMTDAVSFHGRQPFDVVEQNLADAWALVAPSLWAEPFGMVAPEAIIRHVPVIASRSGGFADSVRDGETGLLVPNGDVSALADAMLAVAERRCFVTHRLPAGEVAAVAEQHDATRYASRLRGLFGDVLGRRGQSSRADA